MGRKSDLQREEVLRLYAGGMSVNEILELVDLSYDRVLTLLKKAKIYKAPVVVRLTDSKQHVEDLLKQNKSATEIAELTATPVPIVNSIASKSRKGNKPYIYAGKNFETYVKMLDYKISLGKEIRKLDAEGMSGETIAKMLGVSRKSVARFLQ